MDRRLLVARGDFDRRVLGAGRRSADQQRQLEALPLHLPGDVDHLVQAGRDQPGQPDDVHLVLALRFQDLLAGTITPRSMTS